MEDSEKSKLIAFGQHIEETLQSQTKTIFQYRPALPGFGLVEGDEFHRYDLQVTFSLKHLLKVREDNTDADMAQQLGLIFANEIAMSLFLKVLNVFELATNIFRAKDINPIINYAKVYKEPSIICSPEDLYRFQSHEDYTDLNLMEMCGPNEPYQVGYIDNIIIFSNPTQLIHDKSIYLLTKPLIEYGIAVNREIKTEYTVEESDVQVIYNPVDIYYRQSADLNIFKCFNIEN